MRCSQPAGGALILSTDSSNRRFKFHKRGQLFIRSHNETFSIAAMCVRDKDCSPAGINRCDTAPAPTWFAERDEIVAGFGRTRFAVVESHTAVENSSDDPPLVPLAPGWRHCLIDEARVLRSVFFVFWSYVCRSVQSPRYQAVYVFFRLWRWSLLPSLPESFAIVVVQPRSCHVLRL